MTMQDVDPDFLPEVWSRHWSNLKQQGCFYFESFHRSEEGWSFPVDITLTSLECYGREYGCIFVHDIINRKPIEVKGLTILLMLFSTQSRGVICL